MNAPKFSTLVEGADKLARELKLANVETRKGVVAAIQKNTRAVATTARALAPKRTGEMAGTIREDYANDGLVGMVKVGMGKLPRRSKAKTPEGLKRVRGRRRRTVGPGAYAPVVERGDQRRHRAPHPFLTPALAQQKETAVKDIDGALNAGLSVVKGAG